MVELRILRTPPRIQGQRGPPGSRTGGDPVVQDHEHEEHP